MGGDAGRIRNLGSLTGIVGAIEHDWGALGRAKKAPAEFDGAPGGVLDERGAREDAAKADPGGLGEDFELRTEATKFDGPEVFLCWG